jgi:hypothetical protein
MLGRRSYMRFKVKPAGEGSLRMLQDVCVQWISDSEWFAICREAGVVGDVLVLDLGVGDTPLRYRVRVVESRPVIVEGSVRHQLRLRAETVEVTAQ